MLIYCLTPSDVSVCLVVRELRGGGTEYWRGWLICQSAHYTQISTLIPPRPLGSSKVLNNSICDASEPTVQASERVSICSNWNVLSLLSLVPCWMGLERVDWVFSSLVQYIKHIYFIELVFQIHVYLLVGVTVPINISLENIFSWFYEDKTDWPKEKTNLVCIQLFINLQQFKSQPDKWVGS